MIFEKTPIPGLIVIKPKLFGDSRGFFYESFRKNLASENGIKEDFVQDNCSRSVKNTLRGLHYQVEQTQAKLVSCTYGAVLDVVVDLRKGSPTFGEHYSVELNHDNHWMMFIPKGLAHGFSVLSDIADFMYKCSDYYLPRGERGVLWNDEQFGIDWKVETPILSEKDTKHPRLTEINENDLPVFLP